MKLFPDHRKNGGPLTHIYGIPTRWIVVAMMVMLIGYRILVGPIF